ncbi:MAG: SIMPL domain-containing protein, partial [Acidobacteriota bacterium]
GKDSIAAYYVEANVLMNMKADEYIAVFGLAQEGPTLADANQKMDAQLKQFIAALDALGIKGADVFIDFIAQNKIYDYATTATAVTEKFSGFEVKKNVSVRYKDKSLLDRMLATASKANIFDLIKVDYVLSNINSVRERLMEEAARIIKKKEESYTRLLGIKLRAQAVFQEKYNAFFPSDMYASYTAFETGKVVDYRSNTNVVQKRKTSTFYFNPLAVSEFDMVINPADVEPVVQCTLYLKVRYTQAQ